jgi:hypothetical protein
MIGMKIGKWTENLGALATWGVTAAERDTGKARVRFSWHALPRACWKRWHPLLNF